MSFTEEIPNGLLPPLGLGTCTTLIGLGLFILLTYYFITVERKRKEGIRKFLKGRGYLVPEMFQALEGKNDNLNLSVLIETQKQRSDVIDNDKVYYKILAVQVDEMCNSDCRVANHGW